MVLLAAFIAYERRHTAPLLNLKLFASTQFTAANTVTFVVYAALGGALFLLPIQLQQVSGYTALESGISLLPVTVIMLLLSARSGALASRIGPRLQMTVGPLLLAVGLALFARIGPSGNYVTEVLPAVVVFGLGVAANVAPLTTTVLAAVPAEHAGMASAVNNDVARAASLIAVAVLPAAAGSPARPTFTRRSSRPDSTPPHSSRPGCACSAACWPPSPSATRPARPSRGPPIPLRSLRLLQPHSGGWLAALTPRPRVPRTRNDRRDRSRLTAWLIIARWTLNDDAREGSGDEA